MKIVPDKQPGAKDVETQYETVAVSGRLALLKVRLITGRTHQIRAHMASIGCPILGDSKYGNNTANRELKLKYQALCAWELVLPASPPPTSPTFPARLSVHRNPGITSRYWMGR